MVPSHDDNHFLSRLEYLADIFQQLNKVLISNYKEVQVQPSISLMPQRNREKTSKSWKRKRKAQAGNFACSRILPRRLVMKLMLMSHRKLFITLEGFVRNLCCTFQKSSNQTWIWWKIVLLFQSRMLRIAWKMNLSTFRTSLRPNMCSKLVKFVIFGWRCLTTIQMFEKKLSDSYFSLPAHIYVNLYSLPFCTWKQNIETDSTSRQKIISDALFPQCSQEFTILSKTSHNSKNCTEVNLAVCFALLMLKLNKIWCIIVKHKFCLLVFVPKWRQSSVFYCSVMMGHDGLLRATSGPQHSKGWEPLL